MGRGLIGRRPPAAAARVLLSVLILAGPVMAVAPAPGQGAPYERVDAARQRLLAAWPDVARQYNAAPEPFRTAFETITAPLATLLLSDPENGEVLGAALDLIETVEPIDRQPDRGSDPHRLAVTLVSGARDRLRRSAEFDRLGEPSRPGPVEYRYHGSPAFVIACDPASARAIIALPAP